MLPVLLAALAIPRLGPGRARTRPDALLADKAYRAHRAHRALLRRRGIKAFIPQPADQIAHRIRRGSRGGRPASYDRQRCKNRNVIERGFNTFKQWRGLASRYDKLAVNTAAPPSSARSSSGPATYASRPSPGDGLFGQGQIVLAALNKTRPIVWFLEAQVAWRLVITAAGLLAFTKHVVKEIDAWRRVVRADPPNPASQPGHYPLLSGRGRGGGPKGFTRSE
jgi:transposase